MKERQYCLYTEGYGRETRYYFTESKSSVILVDSGGKKRFVDLVTDLIFNRNTSLYLPHISPEEIHNGNENDEISHPLEIELFNVIKQKILKKLSIK